MTYRIFVVAGEPSGDALAAKLMNALRRAGVAFEAYGIGGPRCLEAGMASLFPMEELSIMGFLEVLPAVPRLRRRLQETAAACLRFNPDLLLTVDSPGFCFRLARMLRRADMLKVHYVAPSVWAYRPGRARKVKALYDGLLALLPMEKPYFDALDLPCVVTGHPFAEDVIAPASAERFTAETGMGKPGRALLTLMPGSRPAEIARFTPVFVKAAELVHAEFPSDVVFVALPHTTERMRAEISACAPAFPYAVVSERALTDYARMRSDVCLLKSGTVSLEQTRFGAPCVAAYKAHPLTAALLRRMIRVKFASLPNIVLGEEWIPERLQERCTPELIAEAMARFLREPHTAELFRARARGVAGLFAGEGGGLPSEIAASALARWLEERRPRGIAA